MTDQSSDNDWEPRSESVLADPLAAYDRMRTQCPVAHSDYLHWSVFRHWDVLGVVEDHHRFSNVVSQHLSVPNGMDPPQHGRYRALIEPFFSPSRMAAFEPLCRKLARNLAQSLSGRDGVEVIGALAETYALQAQCAFLGWPDELQEPLRRWSRENHRLTLAGDRAALSAIARRFVGYVCELLEQRRQLGEHAPDDITTELMNSRIDGEPLSDEVIVGIVRNWTVGEVGTIAAAVGILLHFLAHHPELQRELRDAPGKLPEAIDEILRLHGPLMTNRRRAARDMTLGGREIAAGEIVTVFWAAANRDETVFPDAEAFRWGRDPEQNLLYGAGIHVCPGASLARLELRVFMEQLLAATRWIKPTEGKPAVVAHYPAGGYRELWLDLPSYEVA